MSVALFAVSENASIAVGDDGQLWRLDVAATALAGDDAAHLLQSLSPQVVSRTPPVLGCDDRVLDSASELVAVARECDRSGEATTVAWTFAGRSYRISLAPGTAGRLARIAVDCLLSSVADERTARALLEAPTRVIELREAPTVERSLEASTPPPSSIERWETSSWVAHSLDPAPIIDDLTGIVRRVIRRPVDPRMPPGFSHVHAELPFLSSIDPAFLPDALAPAGALDDDWIEAGALSGISHYCGAYLRQGTVTCATVAELRDRGDRFVTVDEWEPHDPRLYDAPGFPFRHVTNAEPQWLLEGDEHGERCWVPLSLVHASYMQSGLPGVTASNGNNLVGLQAGRSWGEAIERAAAHAVAHDAVAVWWSSDATLAAVEPPARVVDAWGDSRIDLTLLKVPSTTGVPVILAAVDDARYDIVSLGFSAHASADRAAELAVVEALIQLASATDLAQPESLIRSAAQLGNGGVAGLAGFDGARRYSGAFGRQFRGMIDPMAHVQFGLDPDVVRSTRERIGRGRTSAANGPADVTSVVEAVRASGSRLVTVDVATPRVRSAGAFAARVIIPGLARLQPAAFPLDPAGRLARARAVLGWRPAESTTPYPGW